MQTAKPTILAPKEKYYRSIAELHRPMWDGMMMLLIIMMVLVRRRRDDDRAEVKQCADEGASRRGPL